MINDDMRFRYRDDGHFVYPDYNGYNFSNINSTILSVFGINNNGTPLKKELYSNISGSKKVVFFYIDGLGYDSWMDYLGKYRPFQEINNSGIVSPITSVFPSTTAAASNTVNTGLTPAEHGLFEWRLYVEKYNMVLKSLPFIPVYKQDRERFASLKPDPSILFHGKNFYETLNENGIRSYIISFSDLLKSSYSKIMYSGAKEKKRYDFLFEGFLMLRKLLKKVHENSYIFFYIEDPDKMEHRYGPGSPEHVEALRYIASMFNDLFRDLVGEDIAVTISSDHGFTPVNKKTYVSGIRELMKTNNGKAIPETWSPRDMMLHTDSPEDMKNLLEDQLHGCAEILTGNEILKMGLMGRNAISETYISRMGDLLVLPYSGNTIWYKYYDDDIIKDRGMHGGLSREEIIIPFASINLKDIKNY